VTGKPFWQFLTQNDVLKAVESIVTAWDEGHGKLWAKNEEKDKIIQELQEETKLRDSSWAAFRHIGSPQSALPS